MHQLHAVFDIISATAIARVNHLWTDIFYKIATYKDCYFSSWIPLSLLAFGQKIEEVFKPALLMLFHFPSDHFHDGKFMMVLFTFWNQLLFRFFQSWITESQFHRAWEMCSFKKIYCLIRSRYNIFVSNKLLKEMLNVKQSAQSFIPDTFCVDWAIMFKFELIKWLW